MNDMHVFNQPRVHVIIASRSLDASDSVSVPLFIREQNFQLRLKDGVLLTC